MIRHITRSLTVLTLAVIALLILSATGVGQCAMCRASLAGSGNAHFIRNFNIGVLVLLVPPVAMFCSIFLALRRYRGAAEEPDVKDDDKAS
ncbi:MAG TPA: hypothetical protein VJ124_17590 [Pyrinomonadaceae bacterium]|nr:hypothetical protein [Pyrinomonadaceae bacterium]